MASISDFITEIEHSITLDQLRAASHRLVINDVFFQKKLIPYGLAGGHWWAEEILAFFFQRPNFSSPKKI